MSDNGAPAARASRRRRWLGAGGLLGAGVLAGAILAGSQVAGAASSNSSNSASPSSSSTGVAARHAGNPAQVAHGPGETLLSGANLSTATVAAKAAVPGATIIRVETDSNGGAVYEAHMQKADGGFVTVQFDKNLKVTGTVDGFGPGGPVPGSSA
ncbi:MAG: hypothetical protein M3Q23_12425 [Actinomycetota bacterium]|nr:hypothetical protein [Actinomycetota bacterium]